MTDNKVVRADRLIAALLYLQTRGRVTAAEMATELEISDRTARRDLEALALAGIPVYSQRGHGGGWSLVGGARTDLTGLTAGEIRALFLVAGPSSSTPELRTALRKLIRALPATLRPDAEAASKALVIDRTDWRRSSDLTPAPHLEALQRAVVDGTQVRLGYAGPGKPEMERTVHPFGLVSKADIWYLIAGTDHGLRTFRLTRVSSVEATNDPVVRPADFDLPTVWRSVAEKMQERMFPATVQARADQAVIPILRMLLGERLRVGTAPDEGRVDIEVDGPSPQVVAAQIAGLGARLEILEPREARDHLARLAVELAEVYSTPTPTEE
jgi:predicted DNA-binding transcriptional regulator YafY